MKIACDTCGTKYSIDDSRIAGRRFKIRCKQCAHVIVLPDVRAAPAETLPAAGVWYVVADSTPRPITLDELRRLHALGKLDERSLVWREGFLDWCELGMVEELRAAPPCTVEIARAPGASPAPEGAQGTAPPTLRNQRNESSVLFTLGNLARLAVPTSATSTQSGVEGSGLLDIRSLARTLAPRRTERGAAGDVPVFGEVTFGDPSVLLPRPPPRRDRRLVWALASAIGALVIAAMVLVVIATRDRAGVSAAMVPQGTPAAPIAAPAPPAPPAAPAVPVAP
ncbi:MAG TPA: zinc-ribbon domain-containing protein, partial [Kofleriaceae bacterium]